MRGLRCAAIAIAGLAIAGLAGCDNDDDNPDGGRDSGPGLDAGPGDDGGPRDSGPLPDAQVDSGTTDGGLPTAAPMTFTVVADSTDGFRSPTDAVPSLDGTTFYFAAFSAATEMATIYSVPADGSAAPTVRFTATVGSGDGLSYPSSLALSCDGATLFIADPAADDGTGELGAVFSMPVAGATAPTRLAITAVEEPNAVAINAACDGLVISGRLADGTAAIVRTSLTGGAATVLTMGGALRSPTGLSVGSDGTIWALDHNAQGADGTGVLFEITAAGVATESQSGLLLGTPGGVSLAAGGGNLVVGGRDSTTGLAQLTVLNTATDAVTTVALPAAFIDPAGLRSARGAGVFALVDSEGTAIYRGM